MKKQSLFISVLLLCVYTLASQTTVSILAAADNTIYQNPSGNSNALGQNIFSGTNGGGSPRRGLIRFDVAAALPSNATVTAVTLRLNCNTSRSIADNVSLHKVLASWGEGTSDAGSVSDGQGIAATTNDATWNARLFPATLWATAGGDYNTTASASLSIGSTGFYQWSSAAMIADVQSWVNSPSSNFGWLLLCNESTGGTARKFGSKENATVTNRPSLSVTYTVSLPVTLTQFKAVPKNKSIQLSWETSQEINNDFFEVLHSQDGAVFSSVGRLKGSGTSSSKHQYSFTHEVTVPGHHYYKLAQFDFDGKLKYSAVATAYIPATLEDLAIFPNPVLNKLTVVPFQSLQNATYKIIDQNGAVILFGALEGDIEVSRLVSGVYYLYLFQKHGLKFRKSFLKI